MRRISGILLAAGLSRRAAPHHKLLLPHHGIPVARATALALVSSGACTEWIAVLGHRAAEVGDTLSGLPFRLVISDRFAEGIGTSVATGTNAAAPDAEGFLFCPADLPDLQPATVRAAAEAFDASGASLHISVTHGPTPAHPVIVGGWLRSQLATLAGDHGARRLLAASSETARTRLLPVDDPGSVRDIDVPPRA